MAGMELQSSYFDGLATRLGGLFRQLKSYPKVHLGGFALRPVDWTSS